MSLYIIISLIVSIISLTLGYLMAKVKSKTKSIHLKELEKLEKEITNYKVK